MRPPAAHLLKLAYVFRWNEDSLATFCRYLARTECAFYRALHELQRLQADRQHSDPPPPAQTNSAEQSQISPEFAPKPMALNHLPPLAEPTSGCPSPPARNQSPRFVHRMVGVCSA
jgi:hypothetical protein